MATDRPLIRRRRALAAKVETTTGAAIALSGSDGAMNVYDRELANNTEVVEREGQGSLSMIASVNGTRQGQLTCRSHLHGSGGSGSPLWYTTLLRACGFTTGGALDSTDATTLTMGMYEDGRLRSMTGCKGNLSISARAGFPVDANWTFSGKIMEPTAVALIAPTYPTVRPPRWSNTGGFTIGGTAYKCSSFELGLGNQVVAREDANADDDATRSEDGTGLHAFTITGRDVTLTATIEAVVYGTKNWEQDLMDNDTLAVSIAIGTASNNTITIAMPAGQVTQVAAVDENGKMMDRLTIKARQSSASDDELTIVLS